MTEQKMSKPNILYLSVTHKNFDAILRGELTTEYRDRTDYWKSRLDGRRYDSVRLRSGNSADVHEADIELIEILKVVRDGKGQYAIRFGKVHAPRE